MIASGTRLGPYEILAPLGAGGMGEVFRARDTRLDRVVALKILPDRLARDPDALARFQREASSASALNHPHIVAVHDIGSEGDVHYFTMELIEGTGLRERIGREPLKKLLGYLTQVADALAKAHSAGIIHRDLKPENVMISADGYAKLVDFGLAKVTTLDSPDDAKTAVQITAQGMAVGTIDYMSPEQIEGATVDWRSDIFSFGCMLYEAVTGKRPFDRPLKADTVHAIVHSDAAPLAAHRAVAPADLQHIVDRCLAKDPEDRYQSMKEVAIELRAILRQLDSGVIESVSKPRWKGRRAALLVAIAVVIVAAGLLAEFLRHRLAAPPVTSLAILPLVNNSHNADTDYLSDGITDEIINTLSQLQGLRVLARSTVFRFKGREPETRSLGRELGVDAVVLGELRQNRDLVNVNVTLVRTSDGVQLWGSQYNRRMSDLSVMQEDIARDVSEHLRRRLSGEDVKRISRSPTRNPQAYEAYLKGLYFWNQRPTGSGKALQYFEQAVNIDPSDALSHAGVALAYDTLGAWEAGQLPPAVAFPRARAAAEQALKLDPDLPEAHAALGFEELHYARNLESAEDHFRKALWLRPDYGTAHHWYSHLLIAAGRPNESLHESLEALKIEPLEPVVMTHLAWHYIHSRQPDFALEQCRKALELFPKYFWGYYFRGQAYLEKGALGEAVTALRQAYAISPKASFGQAALANALARAGQRKEALSILHELESERARYISPMDLAVIRIGLGDRDGALRELQRAVDESSAWVVYAKVDPRLDPLRQDPRFLDLLQRAGML